MEDKVLVLAKLGKDDAKRKRLTLGHKLQAGLDEQVQHGLGIYDTYDNILIGKPTPGSLNPMPDDHDVKCRARFQVHDCNGKHTVRLLLTAGDDQALPAPHASCYALLQVSHSTGQPQLHLTFTDEAPATPPGWEQGQMYSWPDMEPYFQVVEGGHAAARKPRSAPPAPDELPAARVKQPSRRYQQQEDEGPQAPACPARARKAAKPGTKRKAGEVEGPAQSNQAARVVQQRTGNEAEASNRQGEQQGVMPWPAALAHLMSQIDPDQAAGGRVSMTAVTSLLVQAYEAGRTAVRVTVGTEA
uniref:Uncharacterized protein n=1 Tax=Chlamydomonas leiostraca TaxID=1034604 RepID=A0A7S0RT99_9CHLO